jgi:tRNA(Arg) A34 adenosine deaminase TadA
VDADGNLLLEAENTVVTERDTTGHAETNLVRMASRRYESEFLANCTLYTSTEPCAMCAGAIYWSNIGRVVFALSEVTFNSIKMGESRNHRLVLASTEVFARGQRPVQVEGPALETEALKVHEGFWD